MIAGRKVAVAVKANEPIVESGLVPAKVAPLKPQVIGLGARIGPGMRTSS